MRQRNREPRLGFTLAELIIAIAVIAILFGVAAIAAPPIARVPDRPTMRSTIAHARARALASGHPVKDSVTFAGTSHPFRAMPDGGVLADSILRQAFGKSVLR